VKFFATTARDVLDWRKTFADCIRQRKTPERFSNEFEPDALAEYYFSRAGVVA